MGHHLPSQHLHPPKSTQWTEAPLPAEGWAVRTFVFVRNAMGKAMGKCPKQYGVASRRVA